MKKALCAALAALSIAGIMAVGAVAEDVPMEERFLYTAPTEKVMYTGGIPDGSGTNKDFLGGGYIDGWLFQGRVDQSPWGWDGEHNPTEAFALWFVASMKESIPSTLMREFRFRDMVTYRVTIEGCVPLRLGKQYASLIFVELAGVRYDLGVYGADWKSYTWEFLYEGDNADLPLTIGLSNRDVNGALIPDANGSSARIAIRQFDVIELVPRDLDEEYRDEERGFWAKVLAFLQSIVDGIKAIPEWFQKLFDKIEEIFAAIKDFFAMVWRWITFLFNLVVKALNVMTSISGALPFWLLGAFIALVAVCVIYKILGRESSG